VVAEVRRGVTTPAQGEAVYGLNDWFQDGAQAEYCVARADGVTAKPRSVDHVHAAAVPTSALSAWQGLFDHAHLAAGERVMVHGAAGGVGLFAVQLARWRGAQVIGMASAHNLGFIATSGPGASDSRTRAAFFIVEANRAQLDEIARLIDGGQLRPVVDAVLPLAQARQAYEHKPTHGKVILHAAD
jgi:NADPH:quinone reductase-like Zn-dependent oxidoreductase